MPKTKSFKNFLSHLRELQDADTITLFTRIKQRIEREYYANTLAACLG